MVDTFSGALKILSRRKISTSPGDGGQALQRLLSVVDITSLGLSTTLGTGVYTLLAFAAREHSGPSIVLSFLISSVASCLGGLCYSELSSRFPNGGSAYCYIYATLGELPAFLIGWSLLLEYQLAVVLAAKSWTQYIDSLSNGTIISSLRFETSIDRTGNAFFDFPSALVIITVGLLLTRNLKTSCVCNNVLVFISLLVIGGIVLICMFEVDSENWTAGPGFFPNGVVGIFSGASICFFAFNGYDIIGSLSSECVQRTKVVAVGISLTFLLGLVVCFTISIAITLLVPFSLLDPNASLLEAFVTRHLEGMQYFVITGATCGLISSAIASLLSLSRLLFCLSNDGLLFSFLSKYETNTGVTKYATISSCLICGFISICFETSTILRLIGTGTILSYMFAALCILSLRYSTIERLPFESCELVSRETTITDLRSHSQDITHSISEYYLNKRHNPINKVKSVEYDDNRQNCSNDILCDNNHSSDVHNRQKTDQMSSANNYGSCAQTHSMSVEFINQSFITSISESSFNTKQEPTSQTSASVAGITLAMMGVMLLMGIITIHIPRLFSYGNEWWMELLASAFFIIICICIAMIIRKPRHCAYSRNSIPCVPLLPICAIWMDIHLIVCLPYTSWLAFLIWSLLGVFVYMSYGVWNSKESSQSAHDCDEINEFGLTETSDEGEEIIACFEEINGSSV